MTFLILFVWNLSTNASKVTSLCRILRALAKMKAQKRKLTSQILKESMLAPALNFAVSSSFRTQAVSSEHTPRWSLSANETNCSK